MSQPPCQPLRKPATYYPGVDLTMPFLDIIATSMRLQGVKDRDTALYS